MSDLVVCSECGREAPAPGSREFTILWRGGDMGMVTDDPLMLMSDELLCPDCQPAEERRERQATYESLSEE